MTARHFVTFARDESAAIAVELALLFPVLVILFFGTFEATRLVRANMNLNHAAETMALLVANQNYVTNSASSSYTQYSIPNFCTAAGYTMAPFPAAPLQITVASFTNSSGTAPSTYDWISTTCGGATAPSTATLAGYADPVIPNAGDSVIVAVASYTYNSPIQYVFRNAFTFTEVAFSRPRSNAQVKSCGSSAAPC